MVKIGYTYTLEVVKKVAFGLYLDADNLGEILLPNKVAPEGLDAGDSVRVFVYLDSEDRPIATTQRPRAQVGEFAFLQVVELTRFGAFLDWGLDKHLLLPFGEQHKTIELDRSYLVYLYEDERDGRIVASSKVDKFIDDNEPHHFKERDAVSLIIANTTDLGYKAIVNNNHWGVLYENEVFERLRFGQKKRGFIKLVRPDGKLDLTLNGGRETQDKNAKAILEYLTEHEGYAAVHDKSSPQTIADIFSMSKGAFKKAIGTLYKQRSIVIEKAGIRLVEDEIEQD